LLNEWRKVLNDGLYDQDPEILEEIFTKTSREKIKRFLAPGLLGLGILTGSAGASGKVPGVKPKDGSGIASLIDAFENEDLKSLANDTNIDKYLIQNKSVIETILKKINSKDIQEFSEVEAKVFNELVKKRKEFSGILEKFISSGSEKLLDSSLAEVSPTQVVEILKALVELTILAEKIKGLDENELKELQKEADTELQNLLELIFRDVNGVKLLWLLQPDR
jgi:hypothetical protein